MNYRAEIDRIERTFEINSRIDDNYDRLRAERELKALGRKMDRRKRYAAAIQNMKNTTKTWMQRFQKKSALST